MRSDPERRMIAIPSEEMARGSILGFLARPYLLMLAAALLAMASLSFAHPRIHSLAMAARWPTLAAAATIGLAAFVIRGARPAREVVVLAGFILVATISALYSADRWYSFQRAGSLWLLFAASMVGMAGFCRSFRDVRQLTDLLWWLGGAITVAGFVFRSGATATEGRYEGIFDRATGAGTYAAIFLPIAFYQATYRLRGVGRLVGWGLIALLFAQIVLAAARTALVVSTVVCLAMAFAYFGRKAILAFVAAAVLLPVPFVLNRQAVERLRTGTKKVVRAQSLTTFTGRRDRWLFGLEQFVQRPWLGRGLGISRTLASEVDPRRFRLDPGEVFNLHSDQIEVLVDLGAVGGLAFGLFWLAIAWAGWKVVARAPGPHRAIGLAYLGATFYAFVDTFMHGGFLAAGGGVSFFTWSMIAVLIQVARLESIVHVRALELASDDDRGMAQPQRRRPARLPSIHDLPVRPAHAGGSI